MAAAVAAPSSPSESERHSMTLHDSGATLATSDTQSDSVVTLFDQQHHERYGTILADPPWQFMNRTGKMAPEHRRLNRYATMKLPEILALPVRRLAAAKSHL